MEGKVKCSGCGHSWDKSDSSKKDMFICHQCGKDNVMKNGGWLSKYNDGGFVQPNANDSKVSMSEDFVGLGYNTKGRNYSPAFGGQFQDGGFIPASPQEQISSALQPTSSDQQASPYLQKKDPVEFYKSFINSPEYARRQLLTGYSASPKDEEYGIPNAADSRKNRLGSLENIDPITYDTRQPSDAKPGLYGGSSYININPSDYAGTSREAIEAHELGHLAGATTPGQFNRPGSMSAMEQDIFRKSMLPMKEPVLSGAQGSKERETSVRNLEDFVHSQKPEESKADLNALRYMMYDKGIYDITKGKKFTETDFQKAKQNLGKDRVFKRLENRMGKKNFVNLMNTIASTNTQEEEAPIAMNGASMPGSVGFTYARTTEDKKKDGGVVKDDNGYLNPDNFGKVVEIDSNDITMEGVNQPLLGVSNTGDTKLMKPGKNYKFKGKKVTEFPVAKDGGWLDSYRSGGSVGINQLDAQPMKKLNQLLNFTNNPDKDNWLNKYN